MAVFQFHCPVADSYVMVVSSAYVTWVVADSLATVGVKHNMCIHFYIDTQMVMSQYELLEFAKLRAY